MTRALVIAALLLGCSHAAIEHAAEVPALSYEVALDASLSRMRVRVCPSGSPLPRALVPIHDAALEHLASIDVVDASAVVRSIAPQARIDLADVPRSACVRYDVDLADCDAPRGPSRCVRAGRDLFAPTSTWLLAPETRVLTARYALRFVLPAGVHATPIGAREIAPGVLELDDRAFAFVSYLAFTHGELESTSTPGGACMDVVTLDGQLATTAIERIGWLRAAASASASVTGRVPSERFTTIVVPAIDVPEMPVVFGVAGRGMRPTITLFLSPHASAEQLVHDWTAVHELAHLLVADLDDDDAWLSEGLATYHEEVLRGRGGLLSERDAWTAIADGFERGRANCSGVTLREASRTMHATHAYGCVYWSGAAIALLADVAYRRAGSSLDDAIARAWPHRIEHTSAGELVRWLDGTPGGALDEIATRALDTSTFPDVADTLAWLGVETDPHGVTLADDAPGAAVRRAIMNGRAPETSNPSRCTP